eukprot:7906301-Pyramimonas_sp.AAC.1
MRERTVSYAVIALLLAQLVSHSESTAHKFFGNIDDPEDLKTAVSAAGLDGNIVLVAVGGAPKVSHLKKTRSLTQDATIPAPYNSPPGPVTYWGVNIGRPINPTTKSRDEILIIGG